MDTGVCYRCGVAGHLARDCPFAQAPPSTSRVCFNCGQPGHLARDCPTSHSPHPATTPTTTMVGAPQLGVGAATSAMVPAMQPAMPHMPFQNPQPMAFYPTMAAPHGALQASQPGAPPHFLPPQPPPQQSMPMPMPQPTTDGLHQFPPSSRGRGGSQRGPLRCYRCGEDGHIGRDCPSNTTSAGSPGSGSSSDFAGVPNVCYECGQPGHIARNCPNRQATDGPRCYRCNQPGHLAQNCPVFMS